MKDNTIDLTISVLIAITIMMATNHILQIKTYANLKLEAETWKTLAKNYSERFDEAITTIDEQNKQIQEYVIYDKYVKDLR